MNNPSPESMEEARKIIEIYWEDIGDSSVRSIIAEKYATLLDQKNQDIQHLKERLAFPCLDCEELKERVKVLREALEKIFTGMTECVICNQVHIPYKPKKPKNMALQWDGEGHPYSKKSLKEVAKDALTATEEDAS